MNIGSKNRLMPEHQNLYPENTLFHNIAREVCIAGVLPRKELYESWEVAKRVHRKMKPRVVVDIACGYGLTGQILSILNPSVTKVLAVDPCIPDNTEILFKQLCRRWPFLSDRVFFLKQKACEIYIEPHSLILSVHACGSLTDDVISHAVSSRSDVAVLPCCHNLKSCDSGGINGWTDGPLAVDLMRVMALKNAGYHTICQTIPGKITPKNRLLMGIADDNLNSARKDHQD